MQVAQFKGFEACFGGVYVDLNGASYMLPCTVLVHTIGKKVISLWNFEYIICAKELR